MKSAKDIKNVVVVGAGVMGEGIGQSFAEAGLNVSIVDLQEAALGRCMDQIKANLELSTEYGVVTEPIADVLARIKTLTADHLDTALQDCDLAVEAAPELIDLKKSLFAQFDKAPKDTLLATNTSSFTVSQIAVDMETPERVVGLHYFNPAHIVPGVEVHSGKDTDPKAVDVAVALMKLTGKIPVVVLKESPGFIINRLTGAISREIDHLLDEGIVAHDDLDEVFKACLGFRWAHTGPIAAKDFVGLDTDLRVSRNLYPQLSNRTESSRQEIAHVAKGEIGVKSGRGFFDYKDQSREQVLDTRNRKLLEQRRLFMDVQKEKTA